MNTSKSIFIIENKSKYHIESCFHDERFLILMNVDFATGQKLCSKYGASGSSVGKNGKDFEIGNFGEYYNYKY